LTDLIHNKEINQYELKFSSNSNAEISCPDAANMLKQQPSLYKISSKLIVSNVQSTISTIQCPDTYGCCSYPQASCFSDMIHCCGNDYSCDDSCKRYIRHLSSLNKTDIKAFTQQFLSIKINNNLASFSKLSPLKDQTCPDDKTICSSSSTCCPNKQNNQITYSYYPYSKVYVVVQMIHDLSISWRGAPLDTNYNRCGTSDVACLNSQTCCRIYGSTVGEYARCAFPDVWLYLFIYLF
ncbi:unnamed protein product, partial [Rotaria sp. Silwood2]